MAQILATGKQRAAKGSRVGVGNQYLTFAKYSATAEVEDLDTVNFESTNQATQNTYDEGISGVLSSKWNCGGDFDAGTNPYGSPPGIYPRDDLANLKFYTNFLDAIGWLYPYSRVRSANNSGEVKGKVAFEAAGQNQGPFVFPTGSV